MKTTELVLLNISGGGTKIFGEAACVKAICEGGFKPDVISGVSAGAYLAVPIAMRLFNEIDQMQANFNLKTIFNPAPVNEKGMITVGAALRVIAGKYWLGDQRQSLELLKAIITEQRFNAYLIGDYPEVYVLSVDFRSGANNLVRVRDLNYDEYLDQTLASASIPIFTKGVEAKRWKFNSLKSEYEESDNSLLFDGGIRNHIASTILIDDIGGANIKEVVSIYARPKDYDISKDITWMPSDISTSLTRTIDIMEMQLSKADEQMERLLAENHKFKLKQLFLPSDILMGTYDVDHDRLLAFYNASYVIGKEQPDNATYKFII